MCVLNRKTVGSGRKEIKVTPSHACAGTEGRRSYSSNPFATLALEGGGWSAPCPSRYTPGGKTQCLLFRRLGGLWGQFGRAQKILPAPGFNPRTVQLVGSRCTDYATPSHVWKVMLHNKYGSSSYSIVQLICHN